MNLLQLQNGSKAYGAKVILNEASFSINEGEHVGVIGANGAGKTTLFKILVGRESLDSGEIIRLQNLRVGYLEQEADWNIDLIAEDFLQIECLTELWELKRLGLEIGLKEEHFKSPLKNLSGGYRMRMKLISLIGQQPHLLLLDEPTNFLDLESVLALENFLQDFKGSFLMISHDREFLRRVTESTLEIESGEITKFPGHIDDYFEQKSQIRKVLEAQISNQTQKRKQIEDFINRFGAKATKAKQAQSRMKQLEKMEKIELAPLASHAKIKIPPPRHTGKSILTIENATLGYPQKEVVKGVSLRLERGSHLGVVGVNGAGKSTLLKSLAAQIPLLNGVYSLGYEVSLGYFSQHSSDQLDLDVSILEELERSADSSVSRQEVLDVAGSLLFAGEDVYKKIKVLSGGEKSRVALGQVLLKKCPLLILDEPTNHLDFETVEALTESLRSYEGTVIVVSHDRGFIGRVATQILEVAKGQVEFYPGSYDDYVWSLQKGALSERAKIENIEGSSGKKSSIRTNTGDLNRTGIPDESAVLPKINYKDETKRIQNLIKEKEKSIKKLEEQLISLEKDRLELNQKLIEAQGVQAQEFAKVLSTKSDLIIKMEELLMEEMENLEIQKDNLIQFKGQF